MDYFDHVPAGGDKKVVTYMSVGFIRRKHLIYEGHSQSFATCHDSVKMSINSNYQ